MNHCIHGEIMNDECQDCEAFIQELELWTGIYPNRLTLDWAVVDLLGHASEAA